MLFKDRLRIEVTSGKGGDGITSFRREKNIPKGGPDGGNGGNGGSVWIVANHNLSHLGHLPFHYRAQDGGAGEGYRKTGYCAEDIIIDVPPYTTILEIHESGETELLYELKPGDRFCAAPGGRGGRGNYNFATSLNRAPTKSTLGLPSITKSILLHMNLIAEIGLIGAPNAGKSSLLRAITNAKPEVADYAFTTTIPQIGVTNKGLSVIDIPGLIKDAHKDKGLGHKFLQHVMKCNALICVLDVLDNPEEAFANLFNELDHYDKSLTPKIKLIILNKIDLISDCENKKISHLPQIEISALTGAGIPMLKNTLHALWDEIHANN